MNRWVVLLLGALVVLSACQEPDVSRERIAEAEDQRALEDERVRAEAEKERKKREARERNEAKERALAEAALKAKADEEKAIQDAEAARAAAEEATKAILAGLKEERRAMVGTKMETLTLLSGKRYQGVTVKSVSDLGLNISHASGLASVKFTELQARDQERFFYNPALFKSAVVEDDAQQSEAARAMARSRAQVKQTKQEEAQAYAMEQKRKESGEKGAFRAKLMIQLEALRDQQVRAKAEAGAAWGRHERARADGKISAHSATAQRKEREAAALGIKIMTLEVQLAGM